MRGRAAALVRGARAILLDFDGPVTALMPPPINAQAADSTRAAVHAKADAMPPKIARTTDHLAVLRWAGTQSQEILQAVERASVQAEIGAAGLAIPTLGALDFLGACKEAGKPVVIVSNNAAEAVNAFLARFGAIGMVRGVVGREPNRPDLMKPHPSLVLAGLDLVQVSAREAVLIGDSTTDVVVSLATGLPAIGYAKSRDRGHRLAQAGAVATVNSMVTLATAVHASA